MYITKVSKFLYLPLPPAQVVLHICGIKVFVPALTSVAQLVEHHPTKRSVAGSQSGHMP